MLADGARPTRKLLAWRRQLIRRYRVWFIFVGCVLIKSKGWLWFCMRRQRSRSTVAVVNNGMHVGGHNGMASRWPGRAGARRTRPLPTAAFNSENYMSSRGAANIAYRLFNQGAVRASVRSSSVVLRRLLSAPPAAAAAAAASPRR